MRVWTLGLLVVTGCGASSSARPSNVALSSATIVDALLPDSRMSLSHTEAFEAAGRADTELPESRGSLHQDDVALPASRGSLAEHAIPLPESRGSLTGEAVPALETWRLGAPR